MAFFLFVCLFCNCSLPVLGLKCALYVALDLHVATLLNALNGPRSFKGRCHENFL